jgi:ADP-ribosyl-[dinitrogen reductase] hydrolase
LLQLISQIPPVWQGAVHAALLGDAFGVPHEFKAGHDVPHKAALAMVLPDSYRKTYAWIPYGTWSDDGSQMMALLDALVSAEGRYDAAMFGENLLAWLHKAKYQAGGSVFDCGMQTSAALRRLAQGKRPVFDDNHCGNGSLMRVLPVAALPDTFGVSKVDALRVAMAQSDVTHPQARTRVSCALYIELAWLAQSGRRGLRAMLPEAGRVLLENGLLSASEEQALGYILAYGRDNMPSNTGYVVNSLWSALWAVDRSTSLSDTLRNAVAVGGDTDTVACIAGGLAGLVFGWDDTAHEWRRQMQYLD